MASLRYTQIRSTPGSTIRYIANREKMLSTQVQNVSNVLNYMGEPESTERVYAFARHCSTNPDLAAKQMELYRARYYERRGLMPREDELLGIHFFVSYSQEDAPSEAVMNEIAEKICDCSLFENHATFAAHHYDKVHRHTHIYVSNFSASGKPRKLCMRHKDYNDLRKYANRLCVEHGLSIIDLPTLRYNDPVYTAWIDGVIAGGKITIHPEREEHRGAKYQGATTKQIYFRQMRDKEEAIHAEEKLLTPKQLRVKRVRENYCWNFQNVPDKAGYLRTDPSTGKRRYHAVGLYDENGRKRSLVELICLLLIAVYRYEKTKHDLPQVQCNLSSRMVPDYKLQRMVDCGRVARELNILEQEDVQWHIADSGKQMNALRRERARHENSLHRHEQILSAWDTYKNGNPEEEAFRQAYAILSQNRVLTKEAAENLRQRYCFEQQKVLDYDKRLPMLSHRYRMLKDLEQMIACPEWEVERIKKEFAAKEAKAETLGDKIRAAERGRTQEMPRVQQENER